jgi:hypothetical protein
MMNRFLSRPFCFPPFSVINHSFTHVLTPCSACFSTPASSCSLPPLSSNSVPAPSQSTQPFHSYSEFL